MAMTAACDPAGGRAQGGLAIRLRRMDAPDPVAPGGWPRGTDKGCAISMNVGR